MKPEFKEQNLSNLYLFIKDFEGLYFNDFNYNVFLKEDGLTFVHHSLYKKANSKTLIEYSFFIKI